MARFMTTLFASALVATMAAPVVAQQHGHHRDQQDAMRGQIETMMQRGQMGPRGTGMHGMGPGMMMQGMGPGMMMGGPWGAGPGRFVEGRLAFLKTELAITEDQEEHWSAYADAVRSSAQSMQAMHERMWSDDVPATLPERMRLHEEFMASRVEALRSMREAVEPLYESLDEEQRRVADDLTGMM